MPISSLQNPSPDSPLTPEYEGLEKCVADLGDLKFETFAENLNFSDLLTLRTSSRTMNQLVSKYVFNSVQPAVERFTNNMLKVFINPSHQALKNKIVALNEQCRLAEDDLFKFLKTTKKIRFIVSVYLSTLSLESLHALSNKTQSLRFTNPPQRTQSFLYFKDFSPIYKQLEQIHFIREKYETAKAISDVEERSFAIKRLVAHDPARHFAVRSPSYFMFGFIQAGFEAANSIKNSYDRNYALYDLCDALARMENKTTKTVLASLKASHHITTTDLREKAQRIIVWRLIHLEDNYSDQKKRSHFHLGLTALNKLRFTPPRNKNRLEQAQAKFVTHKNQLIEELSKTKNPNYILWTRTHFCFLRALDLIRERKFSEVDPYLRRNFEPWCFKNLSFALKDQLYAETKEVANAFYAYFSINPLLGYRFTNPMISINP